MTFVLGFVYTGLITLTAKTIFPEKASGSLVHRGGREGQVVGSHLLSQKFVSPGYFWSRPSAVDFATVASGASNKGPTSSDLKKVIEERRSAIMWESAEVPGELLTASGSGLDPHLSPQGARYQISRIVMARKGNPDFAKALDDLVTKHTEGPTLGFMGMPRVNVLNLNLALDELAKTFGEE